MSLRESARRAPRDRWPLEFDLAGVPRNYDTREQLLRDEDTSIMSKNNFSDGQTIDLNKVPRVAYTHQDFPQTLYHGDGRVLQVEDEAAAKKLARKGFSSKPVEGYDYHLLRNGRAPKSAEPVEVSADEFVDDYVDDDQQPGE